MIIIDNERELLPVVRNPLDNWEDFERLFMPIFQKNPFFATYRRQIRRMGIFHGLITKHQYRVSRYEKFYGDEKKQNKWGVDICSIIKG